MPLSREVLPTPRPGSSAAMRHCASTEPHRRCSSESSQFLVLQPHLAMNSSAAAVSYDGRRCSLACASSNPKALHLQMRLGLRLQRVPWPAPGHVA